MRHDLEEDIQWIADLHRIVLPRGPTSKQNQKHRPLYHPEAANVVVIVQRLSIYLFITPRKCTDQLSLSLDCLIEQL
eukprot:scaffold1332_cov197-Alexandrium_tamarense.AAC.25